MPASLGLQETGLPLWENLKAWHCALLDLPCYLRLLDLGSEEQRTDHREMLRAAAVLAALAVAVSIALMGEGQQSTPPPQHSLHAWARLAGCMQDRAV